ESVGAFNALQCPRRDRIPVLDALRFIYDHYIGRPSCDQFQVTRQRVVSGELPRAVLVSILLAAVGLATTDHEALASGKSSELEFPLMLERCRTNNQHSLRSKVPRQYFRGGNSLDGLAEPHIVTDQ